MEVGVGLVYRGKDGWLGIRLRGEKFWGGGWRWGRGRRSCVCLGDWRGGGGYVGVWRGAIEVGLVWVWGSAELVVVV